MSYSFSVTAPTKAEAKARAAKYFDDQVVHPQPVHARDREAVIANINAVVDLLADDGAKDVRISCYGSVSWPARDDQGAELFSNTSISATACHCNRE